MEETVVTADMIDSHMNYKEDQLKDKMLKNASKMLKKEQTKSVDSNKPKSNTKLVCDNLFKEINKDMVQISLRSKKLNLDVNEAVQFSKQFILLGLDFSVKQIDCKKKR